MSAGACLVRYGLVTTNLRCGVRLDVLWHATVIRLGGTRTVGYGIVVRSFLYVLYRQVKCSVDIIYSTFLIY